MFIRFFLRITGMSIVLVYISYVMKKIFSTFFLSVFAIICFAQDSTKLNEPELVERTNDRSSIIHEKFTVLKSNKKVKQGLFQAFYEGKILLATGKYDNGVKSGVWRYCDNKGLVSQVYSYTNKKLIYNKTPDTAFVQFDFDEKIAPTDTLTYPVKIGGSMYGYWFVFNSSVKQFSTDMHNVGLQSKYNCFNILSIDANGMLTRWQLLATNTGFKKLYEVPIDQLTQEDKLFVPATQNGKPIPSKAYVKTYTQFVSGGYMR